MRERLLLAEKAETNDYNNEQIKLTLISQVDNNRKSSPKSNIMAFIKKVPKNYYYNYRVT